MIYYGPSPRWRLAEIGDLWRHRDLIRAFAVRDVMVKYRQTLVGAAWVVLNPVAVGLVFVGFFTLLGRSPAAGETPYPLVVLTGLLPWQLFAGGVTAATTCLVANQNLIGKVYFPRLVLPVAAVVPGLIDFAIAAVLPVGLLGYYGIAPGWPVVLAPLFVLQMAAVALAVGVWLAAVNALYRDAGYVVPLLLQVGFFVSPVIYATTALVPPDWRLAAALNPVAGPIDGFRWALLGGDAPIGSVLASAAMTMVVLTTGLVYFRRVEGVLADRL